MKKANQGGNHLKPSSGSQPRNTHARRNDPPNEYPEKKNRNSSRFVDDRIDEVPAAGRVSHKTARPETAVPVSRRPKKRRIEDGFLMLVCYVCLLLCFAAGSVEVLSFKEKRPSETENRWLQGFPEISSESILSGRFMDEMESYLSDAFFFRDEAASFTERQLGVFALEDDGPDTWDVDAEHLDAPVEESEEFSPVTEVGDAESNTAEEIETASPEENGPQTVPAVSEIDLSLLSEIELYLVDNNGEKRNLYSIPLDQVAAFAQILNLYRDALPEDGTLHFVIPPVSAFANNILIKGGYSGWGSNIEDVLGKVVDEGVYVYDVTDILSPYLKTERLYPLNDHHWHPISASLVAEEMIRNQGLPAMNYYEYRYYVTALSNSKPFYGDELRSLSLPVDTVEIMEPVCPVEAYKVKNFVKTAPDVLIDRSKGGLVSYLGGMQVGPWRFFESGFHTGRNAMLVTDSFGLTLTPYLIPYYDLILFVDLRESLFSLEASGGTIREYIEKYDIDDIYMISSAYNPTIVEQVQNRLFKYLG